MSLASLSTIRPRMGSCVCRPDWEIFGIRQGFHASFFKQCNIGRCLKRRIPAALILLSLGMQHLHLRPMIYRFPEQDCLPDVVLSRKM